MHANFKRLRSAFSKMEVAVSLFLLLLVVVLAPIAIMDSRRKSLKMQNVNALRQINAAISVYQDTYSHLPQSIHEAVEQTEADFQE